MEKDIMLDICIKQGYVPQTCTLDGHLCFLLVNSQGDPCKGCNGDRTKCKGRPKSGGQSYNKDCAVTQSEIASPKPDKSGFAQS